MQLQWHKNLPEIGRLPNLGVKMGQKCLQNREPPSGRVDISGFCLSNPIFLHTFSLAFGIFDDSLITHNTVHCFSR